MPRNASVGPGAALRGVVVHHIEQHLEPRGVEAADHRLELLLPGAPWPAVAKRTSGAKYPIEL